FEKGFELEILEKIPSHVGLGSETQLRLGISAGLFELFEEPYSVRELAQLARRGGTSGIGVASFEGGGFILDGGHYFGKGREKESYLPSRASKTKPAPVLSRMNFPDWDVILGILKAKKGLSGKEEIDFFIKNCPIPEKDVERLSRIILMKLLPSVILKDLREFSEAVEMIKGVGFKKLEILNQGEVVRELISDWGKIGYGVSMSSFGPTVFGFSEDERVTLEMIKIFKECYEGEVIKTRVRNEGARIERV
ncbi:MAG: beta-ribofuranosylaminobenzene 5'-phosphate synthase family protein, partial [Candidatus Methanofastidiosia archaeon]